MNIPKLLSYLIVMCVHYRAPNGSFHIHRHALSRSLGRARGHTHEHGQAQAGKQTDRRGSACGGVKGVRALS